MDADAMIRPSLKRLAPLATAKISLGEGNTPLVHAAKLGREFGVRHLWFKLESLNPTGSYKDRFAAAAVSDAVERGQRLCFGTSSGNAGAALAAYCAKAEIPCVLAIVEGAPEGKLRQMLAYGAKLIRIRGFGASATVTREVMEGLRQLAHARGAALEISAFAYSPHGMEGVQAISTELAVALEGALVSVFSPTGGGGLTLAVARGFEACGRNHLWSSRARVHCVQPAGNDTIATALRTGALQAREVTSTTGVSGLQVGSVIDGHEVLAACRRCDGQGYVVTDERVAWWHTRLAREEGIFCEPAGAVALAGLEQAAKLGELRADEHVVCLVTGSGFKDEKSLERLAQPRPVEMVEDFEAFVARAGREA